MPNIRLVLEYDGTEFHGWQKQPGLRTVQANIEEAVFLVSRQRPVLIGAGRTDAGVHARGQVANFRTQSSIPPSKWPFALNAHLPADIAVVFANHVLKDFHARHSATGRVYEYRLIQKKTRTPLERHFSWRVSYPLNLKLMREAASLLKGTHDFTSFCAVRTETENRMVDLKRIDIIRQDESVVLTFEAPRFLWHMVRNIVGCLVEVGRGKVAYQDVIPRLEGQVVRHKSPLAPPQGLCLVEVRYDKVEPNRDAV